MSENQSVETISNLLLTIIPLILSSHNGSSKKTIIISTLFPIIFSKIFPKIYAYLHNLFINRSMKYQKYKTIVYNDRDYDDDNKLYRALDLYVDHVILKPHEYNLLENKKSLTSNTKNKYDDNGNLIEDNNYIPQYSVQAGTPIKYIFKGNTIIIVKGYNEDGATGTNIAIGCNNQQIINDFVDHCLKYYFAFIKAREAIPYKLYECDDHYSGDRWKAIDINVIKNFKNIFLTNDTIKFIRDTLESFFNSKEEYLEFGIPYKLGYIFHGQPGCGKSSTILAIAKETNRNIYKINISGDIGRQQFINQVKSIPNGNILVFEDIDISSKVRNRDDGYYESESDDDDNNSTISEKKVSKIKKKLENDRNANMDIILEILDGYTYLENTIVIMTTNHIEKLDPAIIRPGRIDHKIEFVYATKEIIMDIYLFFYKKEFPNEQISKLETLLTYQNFTSAEIINSMILPNLKNPDNFIKLLFTIDSKL
jgi:hypothetical protein